MGRGGPRADARWPVLSVSLSDSSAFLPLPWCLSFARAFPAAFRMTESRAGATITRRG